MKKEIKTMAAHLNPVRETGSETTGAKLINTAGVKISVEV